MRRADRLFDIIQSLRASAGPVTAGVLAEKLEVTARTIYRDVAALQASRVPIEGAPGLGYVLRRGYDLPPLMFTADEIDAIAVGARHVRRLRDPKLQQAAESVLAKVTAVVPEGLRSYLREAPFYVSEGSAPAPTGIDPASLREAIHGARKMAVAYVDEKGRRTERTIWPIAMAYYVDVTVVAAWCELCRDFRHFRADRIMSAQLLEDSFTAQSPRLRAEWLALSKEREESPI
ncbi:MAG TPA: YafY family protein [Stellaceae bacterium]|nr:YafY family protein [Stellaceae bacterium]